MHPELSIMKRDFLTYQGTKVGMYDSAPLSSGSAMDETGLEQVLREKVGCMKK